METHLQESLQRVRHVALDMDGTIYKGATLFPFTIPFLETLSYLGLSYSFLTNNPSKSAADYLRHLGRLGIHATNEQLLTSTDATLDYLRRRLPDVRHLYVLGTPSMQEECRRAGYSIAQDDPADEPDAVVVAFDLTLTFSRLGRAAWWIKMGKPYVATNPDHVCPTDQPTILVDCGSITAALGAATGRRPDAVLGKPEPEMIAGLLERLNMPAGDLAVVGDRIYTDVLLARRAGAFAVLVLTGEATEEDAAVSSPPPHLVVPTLREFGEMLCSVRRKDVPA
jgi:HAD superfamily hydrolase (TIGR01450 family)